MVKKPRLVGCACFMLASLVCFVAKADTALVSAFKVSDAAIVKAQVSGAERADLDEAAQNLAGIIAEVTGRKIAIYEEGKEPSGIAAFYLGDTVAGRKAGIDDGSMRNGDWRMKCVPGKAFLFGKTAFAANAAVYDFAERYFGYFLFTADCKAVFTPKSDLAVPICDTTVKPAIYVREIYHGMFNGYKYPETTKLWRRYTRAHAACVPDAVEGQYRVSRQTTSLCHTSFNYLPPEKWFKEHPEYYSLAPDGKRHGERNSQSQLCYTNPDTYRLVLDSLLRFIEVDREKYPDDPPLVYDFTQQDNSSFLCLCPNCRKVIAKYDRTPDGHKEIWGQTPKSLILV